MNDHENNQVDPLQNYTSVPSERKGVPHNMKTRLKPGRKVDGLQRPNRIPFVVNKDEKDYIVLKSHRRGITMTDFMRELIFTPGWEDDLRVLRRHHA